MRISTSQYFETSAASYQKNFADTVKTTQQISSGDRIQTAADDPIGAAKLLMLQQQSELLSQYSGNMTTATNALNQEEGVLSSIFDAMQRASELAIQAGSGAMSEPDRVSIAAEIGEIEKSVFGMLNSKDANGGYLFAGSKSSTQPYVRNGDGTYSYQGDQTQLSVQVSDTLRMATSDTGYSIFDSATNNGRTQALRTAPADDESRVTVSDGLLNSTSRYTQSFKEGQPYTLTFSSATEYSIVGKDGIVTSGKFDRNEENSLTISFRGVDFELGVNLQPDDTDVDAVFAKHAFVLEAKPDSINTTRSSGNSTAQVTGTDISDPGAYLSTFPGGGAVIKFTSDSEFQVYAQPYSDSSMPIEKGTLSGKTITAAGVTFTFDPAPAANDQFSVQANTHNTQNVLDTLSQLRQALVLPDTDANSASKLSNAVASAISNLSSARDRVDLVRGEIGARNNALEIQKQENLSLDLANKGTQAAIGDTDIATASVTLTLQQTMLQASQLAFSRISQLSLFNKL